MAPKSAVGSSYCMSTLNRSSSTNQTFHLWFQFCHPLLRYQWYMSLSYSPVLWCTLSQISAKIVPLLQRTEKHWASLGARLKAFRSFVLDKLCWSFILIAKRLHICSQGKWKSDICYPSSAPPVYHSRGWGPFSVQGEAVNLPKAGCIALGLCESILGSFMLRKTAPSAAPRMWKDLAVCFSCDLYLSRTVRTEKIRKV